jgi:hypothetical protein
MDFSYALNTSTGFILSSPEVKAQVSFSDRPLSVSVTLLHFQLLLQIHKANSNESWHKSSLGEGELEFFKEGQPDHQGEIITKE